MEPLVSILIPCYNAAEWLPQTLESALAQTWQHKEVIVVDDGSTDGSLALAETFAPRGVRTFPQANAGASTARNRALHESRGEFIQFLDADDLLAPDKIACQMSLLAGPDRHRILCSGAWARFSNRPDEAHFAAFANWRNLTGVEFLQLHFEECVMMHPAAWLAPRPLLDRAGPWDESLTLNDDGEYFGRVMLKAERIVFCPAARSYYRSDLRTSLSRRNDPRSLDSLFRSFELTTQHLLAADASPRTLAAVAFAWKWLAFELYPGVPDLARAAEQRLRKLGGSRRPLPAGNRFQLIARLLGWRLAKRLTLAR